MSVIAGLALLGAVHGQGAYAELGYDVAWSDRVGFLTRGDRFIGELGYFTGRYQGSYGFGEFWKFGFAFSWEPIVLRGARSNSKEADRDVFIAQFYNPQFTLSHGANLFRLGFWWKLRAGPVWSTYEYNAFYNKDVVWGGAFSGEVGVGYNFTPSVTFGPRFGIGYLLDEVRTGYQVNVGIGLNFQLPMKRVAPRERADYWEKDY